MNRRHTIQKDIILRAVMNMRSHVSADDIYEAVRVEHPSIGKGTVYRNLNILAEEGKIKKIEIPNGADHFDFQTHRHYHVKCIDCGRLSDVDMDHAEDLLQMVLGPRDMLFIDYDILFKGLCKDCQKKRTEQDNG